MTKQEKTAILERQVKLLQKASEDAARLSHVSILADLTEALVLCLSKIPPDYEERCTSEQLSDSRTKSTHYP